ncbi:hypothetical protein EOM09_05580, partial [bacterium]|nr:hypothetical protein [bacterium]
MENKVYSMVIGGGLEEIKPVEKLPLYSRVYSFGAGMSEAVWAVINNKKLVKMSTLYEDDYFSNPYHIIDKYMSPLSKKFGIGFYYDDIDNDFRFSETDVIEAIKKADAFIIEQKQKQELERIAKEKEIKELPAKYPHLKPINNYYDKKLIKANLIADLKHNFPNTKFSVKCEHHSTYNISWTDGATVDQVTKITNKFENYSSDWTGDYRDYDPSNFNNVFGGFKYIFVNRTISQEILEDVYKTLSNYCNIDYNNIDYNTEYGNSGYTIYQVA